VILVINNFFVLEIRLSSMLCLFKEKSERDKARELTKMLIKADDKLVPEFLQARSETNQQHVADILVGKCLNTFVVLFLLKGFHVWFCHLCSFFSNLSGG